MSESSDAQSPDTAGSAPPDAVADARTPYRVLARKYRPQTFSDLIGQDALVRTLFNAIQAGRMPQAFVLTGVRGVGKTTTARIIARALNCIGADGAGGATTEPCGVCEHCVAIAADRHVDVIEMDAASRTGVDDIRDLIDGVRYRPVTARRKIYIVDEVHMLSKNAFNALLKTLEEPPEHVTFVFATTEIRKVPVTVLSRCMRFDLRRVEQETLTAHFRKLLESEGLSAEDSALAMIARAADGSVRDGLSLLDQAIALSGALVGEEQVKSMLGLADRGRIYDLYDAVLRGAPAEALAILGDLYNAGADPAVVLQDMLEVTHTLSRLQVVEAAEATAGLPETERGRGVEMAKALQPAQLTRNWQILLKGLQETQYAPQPRQAAEMVLLRLIYASELPPLSEVMRELRGEGGGGKGGGKAAPKATEPASAEASAASAGPGDGARQARAVGESAPWAESEPEGAPRAEAAPAETAPPKPQDLREVVALCQERGEPMLAGHLRHAVRLLRFEEGLIELEPGPNVPKDMGGKLGHFLTQWTGRRWVVTFSSSAAEEGMPAAPDSTLADQDREAEEQTRQRLLAHPKVQAVLQAFPEAKLIGYRGGPEADGAAPVEAPDEDHMDEDDPQDLRGDDV